MLASGVFLFIASTYSVQPLQTSSTLTNMQEEIIEQPFFYPWHSGVEKKRVQDGKNKLAEALEFETIRLLEEAEIVENARLAEQARVNRVRHPMQDGWYVTAWYGNVDGSVHTVAHDGIDFGNGPAYGWGAYPTSKGVVTFAGSGFPWLGCGNYVAVWHEQYGITSMYCHLANIQVQVGQAVDPDTVLGEVGTTGYSTGIHLHFSTLLGNTYSDSSAFFDPMIFLKEHGVM
jgi:murein DD-endopeptidase MepM/ murein hydrolase activator NlpD